MADPSVKHLEMPCTNSITKEPCKYKAFVQVVIVGDPKLQVKIDDRAYMKLSKQLRKEHQEGLHDVTGI